MASFVDVLLFVSMVVSFSHAAQQVSAPLYNAAEPGMTIPAIGIGTGAYGAPAETWNDEVASNAIATWIELGGRRIDTAVDYHDQVNDLY